MSKKRILNDEQYKKSEQWLRDNASKIDDPLNTPEEQERLYRIFEATTLLMGDYMRAKECREDDRLRQIRIDNGIVTQDWLDEYWAAMDGKPLEPEKRKVPPTDTALPEPKLERAKEEQPKPAAAALASWLDED